jgi:formylglycine-generating enzyme required for sulfatase activity
MNGVHAVQEILNDAKIGGFDQVIPLINPDVGTARRRIGEVFGSLAKDDLALFYFTGHGIKDMTGDFYLTTAETQLFADGRLNAGTALEAAFIKQEIGRSYAQRKVIILDCCFGAAFAEGFLTMDDGTMDVRAQLGGEGWVVLTAATSRNYALEQAGEPLSVYTRYLVEGLKTGTAAPENQDYISVGNLHDYVRAKVKTAAPTMEPSIFNGRQGDEIFIAKATAGDPELRYRKEVEARIRQGNLPPGARANLNVWRTKLGIAPDRANALEAEVLKPYQERQNHLNTYQTTLRDEIDYAFPLDSAAARDLRDLQKLLNLRDDDLRPVIATTLQSAQPGVAIDPITQFLLSDHPPVGWALPTTSPQSEPVAERPPDVPSASSQEVNIEDLLRDLDLLDLGPPPTPIPQRPPPSPTQPTNPTFEFETIIVTIEKTGFFGQGASKLITRTHKGQAEYRREDLGNGITLDLVKIPGGRFQMGAPPGEEGRSDDEGPQHSVTVAEFWLGKYAVTQAQYQAVMGTNPSRFSENGANRPVEQVSWQDAVAFCKKLSQQTGRTYRLPSEAEWEYACRAGTTTPFHFGPTITTDLANYDGNSTYGNGPKGVYREQTTEVGSFPPNAFGLYDIHGNVFEWCADHWHDNYDGAPTDGTTWLSSDESARRLLRGGAWGKPPQGCRSAYRNNYSPDSRNLNIGFRVVGLPARAL